MIARPQPMLASALVVLAALAVWPWLRAPGPDLRSQSAAPHAAALPTLPALETFRETTDRPLFAPNRRPSAADIKRAVIKQSDGQTARVVVGDKVGEWTVREITGEKVLLAAGDRRLELTPQRARSPAR